MVATVATITVSCAPNETSVPRQHDVTVFADGTVGTSDHDREPWAQSGAVVRALGGTAPLTACEYWRTSVHQPTNTRKHPYANGANGGVWNEGVLHRYLHVETDAAGLIVPENSASESVLPLAWNVRVDSHGWTDAARETFFAGFGINTFSSNAMLPPEIRRTYGWNKFWENPEEALAYLRAVAPALRMDVAHLSLLASLRYPHDRPDDVGVPPTEIPEWISVGVYPYEIVLWMSVGASPSVAADVIRVWATNNGQERSRVVASAALEVASHAHKYLDVNVVELPEWLERNPEHPFPGPIGSGGAR